MAFVSWPSFTATEPPTLAGPLIAAVLWSSRVPRCVAAPEMRPHGRRFRGRCYPGLQVAETEKVA